MNEQLLNQIKEVCLDLLTELEIEASVQVMAANEGFDIQIDSNQAATLIGFHGENLQSLQLMISFLVHQATGEWVKTIVNVGDYRQKREEQLHRLALNLALKVKFSQESQVIPNLNPSERRIVHIALADHPDVVTESEGEGKTRQLTIKPRPRD